MQWRWVWACLLATSGVLVSGMALAECTKDIECKGDRVCTDGVCAPPTAAPPPPTPAPQTAPAPQPAAPTTTVAPTPAPTHALAAAPQGYRRRSKGMMVTGLVLTSVGVPSLIAATALLIIERNCNSDLNAKYPNHELTPGNAAEVDRCHSYATPSLLLAFTGLVFTGTGLPLLLVGARKVPAQSASLGLMPWLSPTSTGLSLRLNL